MKKSKVFTIVLAVALALSFFISCSNDLNQNAGEATVRFAPAATKALNQSGTEATDLQKDVGVYHWEYFCSVNKDEHSNPANWHMFKDQTSSSTGLGTIPGLTKGESYYFGLRGYNPSDLTTPIWEGISSKTKLTSRNQLITITVYAEGKGYLYFNIAAPVVTKMGINHTTGTNNTADPKKDIFKYSYKSLNGATSGTNWLKNTSYDETTELFTYVDEAGYELGTGDYLLTIQQYTWDDSVSDYIPVTERKQVLILNIVAGVNTVVAGTLDSTSPLSTFEYEAGEYTDETQKGLQVLFHKNDMTVAPLSVTAKNDNEATKAIKEFDNIVVENGKNLTVTWANASGVSTIEKEVWVNGYKLTTSTTNVGDINYLLSEKPGSVEEKQTYVTSFDATNNVVKMRGVAGRDYLVTIKVVNKDSNGKLVSASTFSFTVEGAVEKLATSVQYANAAAVNSNVEIADGKISANIPTDVAKAIIGDKTNAKISVGATETERTVNGVISLTYNIDCKVIEDSTTSTNVGALTGYMTVVVDTDKGLNVQSISHKVSDSKTVNMTKCTSQSDFDAAGSTFDSTKEYFFYDAETGKLYLKVASFSPFTLTLQYDATIGSYKYSTLKEAIANAKNGDTIKLVNGITLSENEHFIIENKNITIDLNNKEISALFSYEVFDIRGTSKVTLKAGSQGAIYGPTGDIAAGFDTRCLVVIRGENAELIVEDGTYEAGGLGSDGMYGFYAFNGGKVTFGKKGEATGPSVTTWFAPIGGNNTTCPTYVTVYGGTFTQQTKPLMDENVTTSTDFSQNYWWHYFCSAIYAPACGEITIYGGTFNGYYALTSRYQNVDQHITILGGTFNATTGDKLALLVDDKTGVTCTANRKLTIYAGTFTGEEGKAIEDGSTVVLGDGTTKAFADGNWTYSKPANN